MPDRDDPFIPAGFDGDMPSFPEYNNDTPTNSGVLVQPEEFNPNVTRELVNAQDITDGTPNTWESAHPEATFTQYRAKILRRSNYIPLLNTTGLIVMGRTMLAGFSALITGATGPVVLRDGLDASAPAVLVLPTSGGPNQWYGDGGPEFKYGVYLDLTAAGPVSGIVGSLFVMKDYAQ